MNEITDPQKRITLEQQVRNSLFNPNPNNSYRLYKVWERSNEWYQVEIVDSVMRVYRGVLDSNLGILYLDSNSIISLLQDRIDSAIYTWNAGHWPYKGL